MGDLKIELSPEAYEDLKKLVKKLKEVSPEYRDIDDFVLLKLLSVVFTLGKLREERLKRRIVEKIEKMIEKKRKEKREVFSMIQHYGTKVFELKRKPELTPYEKGKLEEFEGFVGNLKLDHTELSIEIGCLENVKRIVEEIFEGDIGGS